YHRLMIAKDHDIWYWDGKLAPNIVCAQPSRLNGARLVPILTHPIRTGGNNDRKHPCGSVFV
ncbi:MAG: hypothetical protein N2F24_13360, partial [Deltaproteobacteria bacterium]